MSPTITLPYGKSTLSATLPDHLNITHLNPLDVSAADNPRELVAQALQNPVGAVALTNFHDVQTVAIAVNDKTRPVPHAELLPPLLSLLEDMGIASENIKLVIATGTHPVMLPDEYPMILPDDIIARYPIVCHDYTDKLNLVEIGTTSRGTPVIVNRHYYEADLRIVVGNMEPHQFMGFSGGVKSAAIGLAGKPTINHNHALMQEAKAQLGEYTGNPARQDVEEIGEIMGVHFALNAILNGQKKIVEALAGDPVAVMHAGIPRVQALFQVPISAPFDVIIASPGGHPKDINLYQAQKALAHATLVTKAGGTVIVTAACLEGAGSTTYENWVLSGNMHTPQDVVTRFAAEGFQVGPHKAYQLARDSVKVRAVLISEMEADYVRQLVLEPAKSLQSIVDEILHDLPDTARLGIMPLANATVPILKTEGA